MRNTRRNRTVHSLDNACSRSYSLAGCVVGLTLRGQNYTDAMRFWVRLPFVDRAVSMMVGCRPLVWDKLTHSFLLRGMPHDVEGENHFPE